MTVEVTADEAVSAGDGQPRKTSTKGCPLTGTILTLPSEIAQARQEIEDAYNNFQNACDPDLIDCYIYRGKRSMEALLFPSPPGKGHPVLKLDLDFPAGPSVGGGI